MSSWVKAVAAAPVIREHRRNGRLVVILLTDTCDPGWHGAQELACI